MSGVELSHNTMSCKSTICQGCGAENNLRLCAACKTVKYCSKACQKKDWPQHKRWCKCIKSGHTQRTVLEKAEAEQKSLENGKLEIHYLNPKPTRTLKMHAHDTHPAQTKSKGIIRLLRAMKLDYSLAALVGATPQFVVHTMWN